MKRFFPSVACLVSCCVTILPCDKTDAASIQDIESLFRPIISADGSVVVGLSKPDSTFQVTRWTEAGGTAYLGDVTGAYHNCYLATSADGSVIVGRDVPSYGLGGIIWTESSGLVRLTEYFPDHPLVPYDITDDGNLIVGTEYDFSDDGSNQAYMAELGGSITYLSGLNGATSAYPELVSSDGSVIAGATYTEDESSVAYAGARWTADTGWVPLGDLPEDFYYALPKAMSSDGSVIVGYNYDSSNLQAFRWTADTGVVGLGFEISGGAINISADGSIIVGTSDHVPFIWTADGGMRSLEDELTNTYGLDLSDWYLYSANGISADGMHIVGTGYHIGHTPGEGSTTFLITIPEPGTLMLVMTGFVCVLRR